MRRMVGLNIGEDRHHIDHLGVLCAIMDIPLLCSHKANYDIATQYYPGLKACHITDWRKFSKENLASDHDTYFYSNFYGLAPELNQVAREIGVSNPNIRCVYCPHGNSDKGYNSTWMEGFAIEDITLLYGNRMIDFLKDVGVFNLMKNYVVVGNFRYAYYQQNKEFYDVIAKKELLSLFDKPQPIILYAPTWDDLEHSSSFPDGCQQLLEKLPSHYNLMIKFHPRLEEQFFGHTTHFVEKYGNQPNVVFIQNFCPIYALLNIVDVYVGDMSSIGYDFLAFDRPLFFFNPNNRDFNKMPELSVSRCGTEIKPDQYHQVYQMIEDLKPADDEVFSSIRKKVYHHTFSEDKSFSIIKEELLGLIYR